MTYPCAAPSDSCSNILDLDYKFSYASNSGNTKLYFGGTKLYFGGTKLYFGGTKLYFGGTKLYFGGNKLYFGVGTSSDFTSQASCSPSQTAFEGPQE